MTNLKDEEIFILESLDKGKNDISEKFEKINLLKLLITLDIRELISIPRPRLLALEKLKSGNIELTSYGKQIVRRRKFENQ